MIYGLLVFTPLLESKITRSQWCHCADLTGSNATTESAGVAEPETGMCCCVCRWKWLELGGNTEVMVFCEEKLSGQTVEWKVCGEKDSAAVVWVELMTSAGLCEPGACGASRQDWSTAPCKDFPKITAPYRTPSSPVMSVIVVIDSLSYITSCEGRSIIFNDNEVLPVDIHWERKPFYWI